MLLKNRLPMLAYHSRTVQTLDPRLRPADYLCNLAVRWGFKRTSSRLTPGLYRLGKPLGDSPVLVSANYRYTINELRRKLSGLDCWILLLDTKGVNVWCAAGKGSFSNQELLKQLALTRLSTYVQHRRLILPQLGAAGISAPRFHKASP